MSSRRPQRRKPALSLELPSARRAALEAAQPRSAEHGNTTHESTATTHGGTASAHAPIRQLPLGEGVRLVAFHPCGLYVLDKPDGVLSHPNRKSEEKRSLLTVPYSLDRECYLLEAKTQAPSPSCAANSATHAVGDTDSSTPQQPQPDNTAAQPREAQPLYLLHRLDSATSGLLLLADNAALAERIREAFTTGDVRKTYLALCAGGSRTRPGDKGRWSDRLQRERSSGGDIIHVRAGQGAVACTEYKCRSVDPQTRAFALMELNPVSGRTHQLRVHCAQHGLPIIGDGKYGDFRLNRAVAQATGLKRLFLHAARLSLSFTLKGQQIRLAFESPLPAAFDTLLQSTQVLARASATAGGSGGSGGGGRTGASGGAAAKRGGRQRRT